MWLRCGPQVAPHHNKLWSLWRGVVLHHCSYELVNDPATRCGDNTVTSRDSSSSRAVHGRFADRTADGHVPAGSATHRFRAPQPQCGRRAGLSQPPAAAVASSVRRAASGTSGHPTDPPLWNERGQPCELTKESGEILWVAVWKTHSVPIERANDHAECQDRAR